MVGFKEEEAGSCVCSGLEAVDAAAIVSPVSSLLCLLGLLSREYSCYF